MTRRPRRKKNPFDKRTRISLIKAEQSNWFNFLEIINKKYGSLAEYDKRFHEQIEAAKNNLNEQRPVLAQTEKLTDIDLNREVLVISNQVWIELIREFSKSPSKLKTIDRRGFEQLVAFLFENFGYDVELTSSTRDGGRDIIAIKKREVHTKYLIECKRPNPGNKIGICPVRELYGVKVDEGASKAILATTSYFTKDAQLFFERHKWELEPRDFYGVMEWINSYENPFLR